MECSTDRRGRVEVVVKAIDIPFVSIVGLMVKWSIATIPAAIIIAVLMAIAFSVLGIGLGAN